MDQSYRVMLVEDDPEQRANILEALESKDLLIEAFGLRPQAQSRLDQQLPDLLISDIILGDEMDGGFDLARHLQTYQRPIPIIFLSERQSEFDIVAGHDLGAIDYLPKPISLAVLKRKVTNLLRLTQNAPTLNNKTTFIENLMLDPQTFKASWHQKPLNLTVTEFEMLEQFATHSIGSVISYQDLQAATQGVVERNTINTHICRLRQAFKKITPDFDLIHNVYGRGYSWQSPKK
ncbi:response regulator [Thiomicrospira microaerophila]|uniref:response regulator transcription factor n=1 Tax=Thiomicrospira microaerophila TaxID=406020 RepID=UPI00200E7C31|nr:response regulator transcription factor [Thiomicrospira microaerophila]UQB41261.1 response regulator [Thiomicrospira microaerophila]